MIVQRAVDRTPVPWKNGLGVQYEIVCDGSLPDDWTWRLSTADITQNVPFSSFPGVTREFCVADGNGVVLNVNGVDHRCSPESVTTFRGDDVVFATLIHGPMRALNLMVRENSEKKSLRMSTAGQVIDRCSVVVAIHSPSVLIVDSGEVFLQTLDAVLIDSPTLISVLKGAVATL